MIIPGYGQLSEQGLKDSIEEHLFDLCDLAKRGFYKEIYTRLFKAGVIDSLLAAQLTLEKDPEFVCEFHGPKTFIPETPQIRCGGCEEAEWLSTKPAGELISNDEFGPEAA